MRNRKIKASNGEFQLPEPIIHHIQSFLTPKEAAQTAILSKYWRSAWLTRPNLDFPIPYRGKDKYLELAEKTIQRYEQSNLKIESLTLCICNPRYGGVEYGAPANDLITRALKIGASRLSVRHYPEKMVLSQGLFESENLVELSLDGCEIDNLGFDSKVRCSKLESLSLSSVKISSEMISNIASCCPLIRKLLLYEVITFNNDSHRYNLGGLSSRFPSLKDLTLERCTTQEISSRSIERLHLAAGHHSLSVKLDVPSVRKIRIEIESDEISSLSFVSTPMECESDVSIKNFRSGLTTSWFLQLNKLLIELSVSTIYLSLNMFSSYSEKNCQYEVGDIRGLPKPKLESLTLNMIPIGALEYFALFHGLFQICRPKFITANCRRSDGNNNLLCKTLSRGLDDDKYMYGLHDLEDVNVLFFDKDVDAWRPLPLKSFLDPSVSVGKQKVRFQLKWKP
ncbi:hypothetical protein CASFOL_006708 [Castilleja foliolosa]|uniref:F-box/LRR-repeat protein 15/At3g58940/PEG3-like LRR domain-containing protein n=1 Tax=Castilleja foliolosa TaxID=1961234 RepID=A0ABD3EB18_9LAMI